VDGLTPKYAAISRVVIYRCEMDADLDLINTPSGAVDLQTGELHPHDPTLLMTKITSGSYRPGYTQHTDTIRHGVTVAWTLQPKGLSRYRLRARARTRRVRIGVADQVKKILGTGPRAMNRRDAYRLTWRRPTRVGSMVEGACSTPIGQPWSDERPGYGRILVVTDNQIAGAARSGGRRRASGIVALRRGGS
jgi:hypothetical protein